MSNDTQDNALFDLIEHPAWEELVKQAGEQIKLIRKRHHAAMQKDLDPSSIAIKTQQCIAAIDMLRDFVKHIYKKADVEIPDDIRSLLKE